MKTTPRNSYHSFQLTTPYDKRQLHLSDLTSGSGYQRKVRMRDVKTIVDTFDPKLFDEIIVSFRDGRYNVVDGQHRITALRIMNGGADCSIACKVKSGLTYEQEAELYGRLDACKKKLNVADKTRAKAESGTDSTINGIKDILADYCIEWVFKSIGGHVGTNKINATRTLLNAYSLLGHIGFSQAIRLIKETWNGDSDSLNMYIISGMALFVKTYGGEINEKLFVEKLSKVAPMEIVKDGRSDTSTKDFSLKYARAIRNRYNHKSSKSALAYKFNG